MDLYRRVRRAHFVEGMSIRQAARMFNLHRSTVNKRLEYSVPPGYRREQPPRRPKLDPCKGVIDRILEDDQSLPKKQRHTAKRVYDRLRDEHGFLGKYTIVKDYVRERRHQTREMFVPLAHAPGHSRPILRPDFIGVRTGFGEAWVVIGGAEQKAHYIAMVLPHSDACYVKAYPAETTEAFCDGHAFALAFLGGVPPSILYDNTTLAVARILGDGRRQRTRVFSELQSHYLFDDRFGRPGRGLSVGFTMAAAPVHELIEARDERRLLNLQRQLASLKLLIIDELGFVPWSKTGAGLLFEVFSQRYERGSVRATSNLPFDFGSERGDRLTL